MLGEARAALITRGLAEMTRLGVAPAEAVAATARTKMPTSSSSQTLRMRFSFLQMEDGARGQLCGLGDPCIARRDKSDN